MVNLKMIARVLGYLEFFEMLMLLSALAVGYLYGEQDWQTFAIPAGISLLLGIYFSFVGRNADNNLNRRDCYLIVSLTWLLFATIGMLPFLISGATDRTVVAFFESMSGFSTTGASAFDCLEDLSHSLLFWRALTHGTGGIGIIVFTIALLPMMGGDTKLFSAESTGLKLGKLHPRFSTTARWLIGIYFTLTLICCATYYVCGMSVFDAVCHAMSTIATGGFSTHTDSFAWFNSPLLEYVSAGFMFIASINFSLLYLLIIRNNFGKVFGDDEYRTFFAIVIFSTLYITVALLLTTDYGIEESFRNALFNVISLQSTTGFTISDFTLWHPTVWMLITIISCIGACAGSTSGGIKCIRVVSVIKVVRNEFRLILHPRAVYPLRVCGQPLPIEVIRTVFVYLTLYFVLVVVSVIAMMCMGVSLVDALGLCLSAFSNIGPSFGEVIGPLDSWGGVPDAALWICSFLMLAGRLEVFSLLLPFFPGFWRDN